MWMAGSVLLKLLMDLYLTDDAAAMPVTLALLQDHLLASPHESVRTRCEPERFQITR